MKLLFVSIAVSSLVVSALAQQRQSPFTPPATAPAANQNQNTTPANQGVATNPTGDANGTAITTPTTGVNSGVLGQPLTNSTGSAAFNAGATNQGQAAVATSPLFINVTPTTITDANGQPLGTLQQLVLSPNGNVNFGLVNVGGRLTPVPWQLIVTAGAAGRGNLAVNTDRSTLQTAPPVAMGQIPMLAQDEVAQQVFNHFGFQNPNASTQPTIVNNTTARGGTGGAGVTITGGSTNMAAFGASTNAAAFGTNAARIPNNTITNQAQNTTGGLLSPTGRTNGISDLHNSGPGSTDRFGPRQGGNAPPPLPTPGSGTRQR